MEMIMAGWEAIFPAWILLWRAAAPIPINSMCAVFAESEIVGLLAKEANPGDIVLGCVHSICRRTAVFAEKITPARPKFSFPAGSPSRR